MPASKAFADAPDLTEALGRHVDARLASRHLAIATAAIRAVCGWDITETTVTDARLPLSGPSLWIPTMRLTAVTALAVDGAAVVGYTFATSGHVMLPRSYRTTHGAVATVSYVHGYAEVPDELRDACIDAAISRLANLDAPAPVQREQEQIGTYLRSLTYAPAYSPADDPRLARYRLLGAVA